jgi:hypothetical protein
MRAASRPEGMTATTPNRRSARLRIEARLFVLTLRNQPNAPLIPILGRQF